MKILAHGLTDKGLSRKSNQDRFHAETDLGLFVVADGLGGQPAGELDGLLLCSDGLSTMVADEETLMLTASEDLPESVCTRLVHEANNNGGRDNITVVTAFFTGKV